MRGSDLARWEAHPWACADKASGVFCGGMVKRTLREALAGEQGATSFVLTAAHVRDLLVRVARLQRCDAVPDDLILGAQDTVTGWDASATDGTP